MGESKDQQVKEQNNDTFNQEEGQNNINEKVKTKSETSDQVDNGKGENVKDADEQQTKDPHIESEKGNETDELEEVKKDLEESREKYLRLYSEFENFRRRTSREKLDIISNASESVIKDLLPVIDDFNRAQDSIADVSIKEVKPIREGVKLIRNKLNKILDNNNVNKVNIKPGDDFDPEVQEAITQVPAPKEELKGKIVDVIEAGYKMNDKVIRFAKVVIGS
ncbi:MAG TPA: nucleotide exchange factor GrpE [Cyclobacteriaceae bacterium]